MHLNNLEDMIKDYERLTEEVVSLDGFFVDEDGSIHDETNTYFKFFKGKGFLFYEIREHKGERYIVLLQTYGFFKYMASYVKTVMKLNNIEKVMTFTTRLPKAHIRKWKMELLPEAEYDFRGKHYYALVTTYDNVH